MTRRVVQVEEAIRRLRQAAAASPRPLTFMEICGTHTVAAFRCGLHSLMPQNVRLLSGPGCPVCVTAQRDIDEMVDAAALPAVTLCTYGDMIRVPGTRGSLATARSNGAAVKVVYSALDAVKLAEAEPNRQVIFVAVGFETTAPATAAAVLAAHARGLGNFSVLSSHKTVVPAVLALLASGQIRIDGLLCPGHVSVIIGSEAYRPIVERFGMRCVIAGFEETGMAAGIARLAELARADEVSLVNLYPQAVTPQGNKTAQELLSRVFEPSTARWRALGEIPDSGLSLRSGFRRFDARERFGLAAEDAPEPKGCRCGQVITGQATPVDCKLFATTCTPINPVGPCMVSSEGTCQAWFKYNRQQGQG